MGLYSDVSALMDFKELPDTVPRRNPCVPVQVSAKGTEP